jgi:hypothetical protein
MEYMTAVCRIAHTHTDLRSGQDHFPLPQAEWIPQVPAHTEEADHCLEVSSLTSRFCLTRPKPIRRPERRCSPTHRRSTILTIRVVRMSQRQHASNDGKLIE